jgi:mono/diheme cytochrome c family protein
VREAACGGLPFHLGMAIGKAKVMQCVRSCAAVIGLGAMLLIMQKGFAQDAASAQDRAKIEAGENVYNNNCQVCHGDRLVSTGQFFDLRRLTANDRARFDNSVRNGKNQMPPWKGVLTDEEIDQLWSYIRANAYEK